MASDLLTDQFVVDSIKDMKEDLSDSLSSVECPENGSTSDSAIVLSNEMNIMLKKEQANTKSNSHVKNSKKIIHSISEDHDIFSNKFDCPVCSEHFDQHKKFVKHLGIFHKDYKHEKKVKCPVCKAVCADWGKFTRHLAIHTGKKGFECDICHREFSRKDHMRKHRTIHVPEDRPYSCPYCDKKFCENNILQRHLNSHTGHKPYKCGICGMAFFGDSTLKQHVLTHSEDRPFLCTECGMSFRRKGTLKHHMNVHWGQKPHECGVCHMKYTTRQTLVAHSRIHTGEMPYQCSKCCRQFMRRDVFKYHINRKRDCRKDKSVIKRERELQEKEKKTFYDIKQEMIDEDEVKNQPE